MKARWYIEGGCTTQIHADILYLGPSLGNTEEGEEGSARLVLVKLDLMCSKPWLFILASSFRVILECNYTCVKIFHQCVHGLQFKPVNSEDNNKVHSTIHVILFEHIMQF